MVALLLFGGFLLYSGGDFVVKGASRLAGQLGISPLAVGLTIVAFGTSLPELVVSLVAALQGRQAIAMGNIIGSNIANVGLILGLSASLFRIRIMGRRFRRDFIIMTMVSLLFATMLIHNGVITRWKGLILFSGLILYVFYSLRTGKGEAASDDKPGSIFRNIIIVTLGIIGLNIGAILFVRGAAELAKLLGVTEMVIGLTLVAYGTSLPELATSLVAAYRGESEISVGNIIGSNLFNIMGVIGSVSLIRPLAVDTNILTFELPVMIVFAVSLFPVTRITRYIPRIYGMVLLTGYVAFLVALFIR